MSFVPMRFSRGARYLQVAAILLSLFKFAACGRADEGDKAHPPTDDNAYETDRPGELENPFALTPGRAQLVSYVVAMNAAAREDDFDTNASAVFLDTAVRIGVTNRIEGVLAIDTFLKANVPPRRGGGTTSGLGYATLFAKWNFLADPKGEYGIAIAPFVRLPLQRSIGGSSRSESGLIVPFEADLEGGWELQGSTGVSRAPDGRSWSTQYQNQVEVERALTRKLTAYLELELEAGEGQPHWGTELGVTCQLTTALQFDLGTSLGLGRISRGREVYAGLGWRL
jgi:hypothetical protein